MKLTELATAVNIKIAHTKEELDEVKDFFLTAGKLLQSIEGNKYKLINAKNGIGMFTVTDEFVGFLQYSEADNTILSLDKIFILPEYRNRKIAKIFLYWFKMAMKKAVFVGGAVFSDGQNFINSLVKDPRFEDDIVGYDIRSKERFDFDPTRFLNGKTNTGFLFEQNDDFYGMYDNSLPGRPKGSDLICLEMFANESENENF